MSEFHNPYVCQNCRYPLEDKPLRKGETLCPSCDKMIRDVNYLLAATSEEDADRRFEQVFGVLPEVGGTSTPKRRKNQKVGRKA